MRKIKPETLHAQWVDLPHAITVNVHNFTVLASKAALEIFDKSFDEKRFYSADGKKWHKRVSKKKQSHPLLQETGTLRNSIVARTSSHATVAPNLLTDHAKVFTDPTKFTSQKRHKGFCYAAVHNNFKSLVVKPMCGPKYERKFMGHSTYLLGELQELEKLIFDKFPK
jgi:hypothetical protein